MIEYALMVALLSGSTADRPQTVGIYASVGVCANQMPVTQAVLRRVGFTKAITSCEAVAVSPIPKRRPEGVTAIPLGDVINGGRDE